MAGAIDRLSVTVLEAARSWSERLADDVRAGLTSSPKVIPPKYFYDERGSELFEEITRLPEYYLTRVETEILERRSDEILRAVEPSELIEIGSGSSTKTALLLEAMRLVGGERYVPLDVSEEALRQAADRLVEDHPWLEVDGYVGDFEEHFPALPREGQRIVAFLGSTIGNLEDQERAAFLRRVRELMVPGDRFLLGVDLVKDADTLVAAYDDASGVTAAFNLNLLAILDRELGGDLPLDAFRHVAVWNPRYKRMESYLEAVRDVRARLDAIELDVDFAAGERVRTEVSCKFDRPRVESDLAAADLVLERWLTDAGERFALALAAPA